MSNKIPLDSIEASCKDVSSPDEFAEVWASEVKDALESDLSPAQEGHLLEAIGFGLANAEINAEGQLQAKESYIKATADLLDTTKTNVRNAYNHAEREVKSAAMSDSEIYLTDLITQELDKVVKQVNTDTNQEARYVWTFDADAGLVVTTKGEYKVEQTFINTLEDTLDRNIQPTGDDLYWADWIQDYRVANQVEGELQGPRSRAMEDLQQRIRSSQAICGNISTALHNEDIYLEEEESDTLQVASRLVQAVADEHDLSMTALQSEMSAKDKLAGKARLTHLDTGKHIRLWQIKRSWAEPDEVVTAEEYEDSATVLQGGSL